MACEGTTPGQLYERKLLGWHFAQPQLRTSQARHTDRQSDRETDRDTHTRTHTHTRTLSPIRLGQLRTTLVLVYLVEALETHCALPPLRKNHSRTKLVLVYKTKRLETLGANEPPRRRTDALLLRNETKCK